MENCNTFEDTHCISIKPIEFFSTHFPEAVKRKSMVELQDISCDDHIDNTYFSNSPKSDKKNLESSSSDEETDNELKQLNSIENSTGQFLIYYKKLSVIPIIFFVNLAIILLFYFPLRSLLQLDMFWNFDVLKKSLDIIQENINDTEGSLFIPLLALYSSIYIFIQTFCIPGSILLNCIGGAIFGIYTGTIVCSLLTALGSYVVYLFFRWIGEDIVSTLLAKSTSLEKRVDMLNQNIVNMTTSQRFFYLLALRIFPLTPQYVLNLASPFVGVGTGMFLTSMVIGLLPFHFITVRAGSIITQIQSSKDILQTDTIILLGLISFLLLTPTLLKKSIIFKKYFSNLL